MSNIPEFIERKLEFDEQREFQDKHIIEAFVTRDKPVMAASLLGEKLNISDQAARDRIEELVEKGIIEMDKVGGSYVYWINYPESHYPVPPDVEVEPTRDSPTITELWNQNFVKIGVIGLVLSLFSSFVMYSITVIELTGAEVPFPVGLLLLLLLGASGISLVAIFISLMLWLVSKFK